MRRKKRQRSPGQDQGRPPLENGRRALISARLSEAERESCELAAHREGKTLSEWARVTLLLRAAGLGLLLFACGARTELGSQVTVDGEPRDGGSGGAVVLGAGGSVRPAGGAPVGSGGRVGAGGAPGAGGRVVGAGGSLGAGGRVVASGGSTAGSGGDRPATGGVVGAGGAIDQDAGPNYCDPAVQCAAPPSCNQPAIDCPGRKCAGIWDCGHGQEIDCTFQCAADEYCPPSFPPSPSYCHKIGH